MTGIERLHGIAKASRGYTWSQSLSYTLEDIAKQIEREQAKDHKIAESVRKYGPIGADYLPIRNGDEVWAVRDGNGPFKVVSIDLGAEFPITLTRGDGGILMAQCTPDELTHTKPVVGADGLPIHEGETVYLVDGNGDSLTVIGRTTKGYQAVKVRKHSGYVMNYDAIILTHTKPEPPDSWERLESDMADDMAQQQCGPVSPEVSTAHAAEFVRRAKALAERERGER